jgi:hypothetical protein
MQCWINGKICVEDWNNGIIGFRIMQCWINGKICVEDKTKNG